MKTVYRILMLCVVLVGVLKVDLAFAGDPPGHADSFPRSLESYPQVDGIWATLKSRASEEPFNVAATLIFFLAIVHTFLTSRFMATSHKWAHEHEEKIARGAARRESVSAKAELFHFLGEVEAVFGIWAIVLICTICAYHDWGSAVHYVGYTVNFTEPAFVVVIMTLAATRPILRLSENIIKRIASLFGGSLTARWLTTLTIGPILGSFITEPAAMTISALLLGRTFYALEPSTRLKYGTLGLLLVNISVGGTFTHFAAPPVLMVAAPWDWGTAHMMADFGWKAAIGILLSNGLYLLVFRREILSLESKFAVVNLKEEIQRLHLNRATVDAEFDKLAREIAAAEDTNKAVEIPIHAAIARIRAALEQRFLPQLRQRKLDDKLVQQAFDERFAEIELRELRRLFPGVLRRKDRGEFVDPDWDSRDDPVPVWVTLVHVLFMVWTIITAHYMPLFVLGMLFFLGFAQISSAYQNRIELKPAMLVGFFLAGLVIHGGVQGWWIAPILGSLAEVPLMAVATVLTAFNDNAAITYLATLVPNFSDGLKHAVVAGAVTGGGLTIIANAPNPAGIALLKKYFGGSVSPLGILSGSLVPTILMFLIFMLAR